MKQNYETWQLEILYFNEDMIRTSPVMATDSNFDDQIQDDIYF